MTVMPILPRAREHPDFVRAGAVLTIDLAAVAANWKVLAARAGSARCAAVVKADAYGLGAARVAPALAAAGCDTFFVAHLDEAIALRRILPGPLRIAVLHGPLPGTEAEFLAHDVLPVLNSPDQVAGFSRHAAKAGRRLRAILQTDSGMSRFGLSLPELDRLLAGGALQGLDLVLHMSHLACADEPGHGANAAQRQVFLDAVARLPGVPASLSASSGIFLGADYHFDLVRPGAALYGVNPTPEADNPMQPVADIKARIVQLRELERGDTVGYGGTWTARRPTRIAVISAGYADGYFRAAGSNDGTRGADVIIAGKRCPVAGRISMDLIATDITDLPPKTVKRGHMATLLGEGITVDELAHHFGTIGYEVLTSLGKRYTRVYKGEPAAAQSA
jgi:alanine racemase